MSNDYIDIDTMIALDIEWSDFVNRFNETFGTISSENREFENRLKRHLINMSIKYKVNLSALKKRYDVL